MMPAMTPPVHESESKHFLDLIDSIPSLIRTGRPDEYLDYFNRQWLQYLGLPLEDILGWKWTAVIHPEDVERIVSSWRLSLASGDPFLYEARVRRADRKYRWMLHRKVAVRDEAGDIVRWYGSSIDIEGTRRGRLMSTLWLTYVNSAGSASSRTPRIAGHCASSSEGVHFRKDQAAVILGIRSV
jgi:PAS domain S-box-containing protein